MTPDDYNRQTTSTNPADTVHAHYETLDELAALKERFRHCVHDRDKALLALNTQQALGEVVEALEASAVELLATKERLAQVIRKWEGVTDTLEATQSKLAMVTLERQKLQSLLTNAEGERDMFHGERDHIHNRLADVTIERDAANKEMLANKSQFVDTAVELLTTKDERDAALVALRDLRDASQAAGGIETELRLVHEQRDALQEQLYQAQGMLSGITPQEELDGQLPLPIPKSIVETFEELSYVLKAFTFNQPNGLLCLGVAVHACANLDIMRDMVAKARDGLPNGTAPMVVVFREVFYV